MLKTNSKYSLLKGWGPSSVTTAVIKEGRCDGTVEDRRFRMCLGENSHRGGRFYKITLLKERGVRMWQAEAGSSSAGGFFTRGSEDTTEAWSCGRDLFESS